LSIVAKLKCRDIVDSEGAPIEQSNTNQNWRLEGAVRVTQNDGPATLIDLPR
jgi:hypothetical protein